MRICLVSREMTPFWGAGIGTYVSSMVRAWASGGHEVHVLGVNDPECLTKGPRLFPGVRFHDVDPLQEQDDRVLWRSDVARRSQQVRRALMRLHAAHRFDYVEFPEYFAEGAMAIRGARMLGELGGATLGVRLHSPDRLCRELNADPVLGLNRLLTDRLELGSISEADVAISPTRSLLEWCAHAINGRGGAIDGHRAVVPYPFDRDEFFRSCGLDPSSSDGGPAPPGRMPEILYFGRLERRKGVDLLINAFGHLVHRGTPCTLRLIGSDTRTGPGGSSMREHLVMRLGSDARERVAFEDRRPRAELGAIVRSTARSGGLCCFPSRWENFPNVALEAMSLGAPVLCADGSGMAEIVEHERSGLLFETGNEASLIAAIDRLLADKGLRERISLGAPGRIRDLCDPARVLEATIEAIGSARRTRPETRAGSSETTVLEIVIDGPSAVNEVLSFPGRGLSADARVILRAGRARIDPRLAEAAARIMGSDPAIGMVTSHVVGSGPRESWVPLGLDSAALCALDLSGLGAGAVVRAGALASIQGKEWAGVSGPHGEFLPWLLGAALAASGWKSAVVPESWIHDPRPRDPYAIDHGQHRARMQAADILEAGGVPSPDAARVLAAILTRA